MEECEQNDLSLSRPSTLHYSSEIHPYVSEFIYICTHLNDFKLKEKQYG